MIIRDAAIENNVVIDLAGQTPRETAQMISSQYLH